MLLGLVLLAVTLIITIAAVHDSQVRRKGRRILRLKQSPPASSPAQLIGLALEAAAPETPSCLPNDGELDDYRTRHPERDRSRGMEDRRRNFAALRTQRS